MGVANTCAGTLLLCLKRAQTDCFQVAEKAAKSRDPQRIDRTRWGEEKRKTEKDKDGGDETKSRHS